MVALLSGKVPLVPVEFQAGWAPGSVQKRWGRKSFASAGDAGASPLVFSPYPGHCIDHDQANMLIIRRIGTEFHVVGLDLKSIVIVRVKQMIDVHEV